jgi:hypothetical protein
VRTKTQSEIILIAYDLNKSINFLNTNINQFKSFINTQKLIRGMDEIHIIEADGSLYLTTLEDASLYRPPLPEALEMVLNDKRPLKILNAYKNQSASIIKLENFDGKYLYIAKYLDKKISQYLIESQEALNFYYTVLNKQTGIKISFVFIYLVIVSLLLFLSISIAIRFSSRFFRSINNLIIASSNIGKGNLNTKVPEIKADRDMEILNKNFNLMTSKLRAQQEKLIINERHEAWESLARKLAHEIKNPLTPIQLTIDRLKSKYSNNFDVLGGGSFKVSSLLDDYYGLPGNQGISNTNWGFKFSNGASGYGHTSQHMGLIVPYKCQLVGIVGNVRSTTTGDLRMAIYTATLVDGAGSTGQTWTKSIESDAVACNNASKVYQFFKNDGTVALEAGDSVVPSVKNETGATNTIYGTWSILIRRVA